MSPTRRLCQLLLELLVPGQESVWSACSSGRSSSSNSSRSRFRHGERPVRRPVMKLKERDPGSALVCGGRQSGLGNATVLNEMGLAQ